MSTKRTAGVGAPAATIAPAVGAPYGDSLILPHSPADCQSSPLADLVDQAAVKAARAAIAAETCRLAGDVAGWELWRRKQLRHQMIARSLRADLRGAGGGDD